MCLISPAACCSHHHRSTSRSTYSLLHICPRIISSNLPSPLRRLPPSSETQALTMAEPSSVRRKSGWNSLPTEVIKLIVSRVDNLSTMPLAACSSGLYRLLQALRPELFKLAPCLLMPPDLQKQRVTQHNDRRVASINPLHCDPIPSASATLTICTGLALTRLGWCSSTVAAAGCSWRSTPDD